eukprot:14272180-Ditylum_brightwellii.AAC.1
MYVRSCVDACFHETVLPCDYLFKFYGEVIPKEDEVSTVAWANYNTHPELVSLIGFWGGNIQ